MFRKASELTEVFLCFSVVVFLFFSTWLWSIFTLLLQGNVEVWLGDLLRIGRRSVHTIIRSAAVTIGDQGFNLLEFENTYPSQVSHHEQNAREMINIMMLASLLPTITNLCCLPLCVCVCVWGCVHTGMRVSVLACVHSCMHACICVFGCRWVLW